MNPARHVRDWRLTALRRDVAHRLAAIEAIADQRATAAAAEHARLRALVASLTALVASYQGFVMARGLGDAFAEWLGAEGRRRHLAGLLARPDARAEREQATDQTDRREDAR